MRKNLFVQYVDSIHEGGKLHQNYVQYVKLEQKSSKKMKGEMVWADEHRIGVAKGVDEEILEGLRANFVGECTEVGNVLSNEPSS